MKKVPWPLAKSFWIASIGVAGLAPVMAATQAGPATDPPPSASERLTHRALTGLIVASDSTQENAPANIYVTNPEGRLVQYLTQDNNWNRNAGWSYDGTKVVWDIRNSTGGIWVMDSNGANKTELTAHANGAPSYAFGPAFSPDGKHIVYSDYQKGSPGTNPLVGIEIYVMNADGTNKQRLTKTTRNGVTQTGIKIRWSERPAYSPDNTKIVYSSTQSGNSEIWIMNLDGSQQQQLTVNNGGNGTQGPDANFASFSPDGTKLVFLCGWETLYGNICVMNADGSGRTQLTTDHDNGLMKNEPSNDEPAWSADGGSIMFDSNRYDPALGLRPDLARTARTWIMNADGSIQRVLFSHIYGEGRNPWIN